MGMRNGLKFCMKTYEQKKYRRKETLGEYLSRRLNKNIDPDELDFYIQQYKIKEGHSEWSERFQRNFWVEDED